LTAPQEAGGWQRQPEQATDWRPSYRGATASVFETFVKGDRQVALYVAVYRNQSQGAELINSQNVMIPQKDEVWSNVGESKRVEPIGTASLSLRQTRLRSAGQRLLIWDWFVIGGEDLVSPYRAKLIQARDQLLGRGDDGVAIIVAAPYAETPAEAEQTLRQFIAAMRPSIDAATAKALGQ
jgi:EpsI family protein